jgi:mannitol-1-phosphate/altronate dehydrogenase
VLTTTAQPLVPSGARPANAVEFVGSFVRSVADRIGPTVQPAAAAAVATTFGFPLALMAAVLLFLVIQSRFDGGDPKLRSAPMTTAETVLPYADRDRS